MLISRESTRDVIINIYRIKYLKSDRVVHLYNFKFLLFCKFDLNIILIYRNASKSLYIDSESYFTIVKKSW